MRPVLATQLGASLYSNRQWIAEPVFAKIKTNGRIDRFQGRSAGPPAAPRHRCWHGSPRNAVHEYVGASNAAACLAVQRAALGLVGHTPVAAAWRHTPGGASAVKIAVGVPLDLAGGRWLLNPGAVGAPSPSRLGWWDALDLQAADGAYWLLLDLERHTATWRRAPYDPAPARQRARALGLDDGWSRPRTVTGARGGRPYG
jgi:hypothetical protein